LVQVDNYVIYGAVVAAVEYAYLGAVRKGSRPADGEAVGIGCRKCKLPDWQANAAEWALAWAKAARSRARNALRRWGSK